MADKFIQVPTNVEDPTILKRFITELVDKLNSNASLAYPILYPPTYTGNIPQYYTQELGNYTNTILEASAKLDTLSREAKNYITKDLQVQVLSNSEDIATITTEFGTFYDNATAAAWYGLTVKAGELISGFTIGGVDTDTTSPGTAGSFFAINANTFSVGRAIEDINDPAELAYVQANNLPYGTMYNTSTNSIIPAFIVDWNGTSYDIFFNGKVSFTNVADTGDLLMVNDPISNLSNNLGFTTGQNFYQTTQPTTSTIGDLWIDTDDNNKVYTWNGTAWALVQDSYSALQAATTAQDTADGKIESFYQSSAPLVASEGDIWFDTDDGNKIYTRRSGSWVVTQDSQIGVAIANSQTAQTTADGKAIVHYQASAPTGKTASDLGDLWIDTDDNNKVYTWNGAAWALVQDSYSANALAATKNVVFYQIGTPTATKVNDLWFDTDDNYKMYIWNGTTWVNATQNAAIAINSNTTTIDGSKITTGTIEALQIAADTITAAKIVAGTITADKIATGTITADKIATGTITADKIATSAITADKIAASAIIADKIAASTITADKMNITSLSSISANIGTITAGTINANVINAGILNLTQIPILSSTHVQAVPIDSVKSGSYAPNALFALCIPNNPVNGFKAGKIVTVTISVTVELSSTTTVSNCDVRFTSNGAGATTSTVTRCNPSVPFSTGIPYTFNATIYYTPTSDTAAAATIYMTHGTTTYPLLYKRTSGSILYYQNYK